MTLPRGWESCCWAGNTLGIHKFTNCSGNNNNQEDNDNDQPDRKNNNKDDSK